MPKKTHQAVLFVLSLTIFDAKKIKTSANQWQRSEEKEVLYEKLCDGVWAKVATFAGFTMFAYSDVVKLVDFVFVPHDSDIFEQARLSLAAPSVHGLFNDFRVIC